MKTIGFLSILLSLFSPAPDCTVISGVAYQRTTIPGSHPRKQLDESGKQVDALPKLMNSHFIFIETAKNCIPAITQVWIAEKAYNVTVEEIRDLPVVLQSSDPRAKADTLVTSTSNRVFRIVPTGEVTTHARKKPAMKKNKVIIEYTVNSKPGSFAIRDIKRLTPIVLQ